MTGGDQLQPEKTMRRSKMEFVERDATGPHCPKNVKKFNHCEQQLCWTERPAEGRQTMNPNQLSIPNTMRKLIFRLNLKNDGI